jgi:hypothetical protein
VTRWRWLLLLPVAVLLVLAASASRVQLFWAPGELRDVTVGRQGEVVAMADRWEDDRGDEQVRRFDVTLVDVRPARYVDGFDGPEPVVPPAGVAAWEIVLEFEVGPDVPLGSCSVSLIDTQDREARATGGPVGEVYLPSTMCEPENRRGPAYDGSRDEDYLPRLPTYRVAVFAVTADDAEPAAVRLWWEPTDVVEIQVSRD